MSSPRTHRSVAKISMAIADVERACDLAAWSGRALGTTPWRAISQATIGAFAEIPGDDH
jgi:hypothetical protein